MGATVRCLKYFSVTMSYRVILNASQSYITVRKCGVLTPFSILLIVLLLIPDSLDSLVEDILIDFSMSIYFLT